MKSLILLFTTILFFCTTYGKTQVAFLEFYDPDGNLVVLEPGGRFGHVAIAYKGGWVHAYPPRPVEWVPDLRVFGKIAEIVEVDHHPLYTEDFIEAQFGIASNVNSEWNDKQTTYCSKFVGKILGIPPRPNNWSAEIWSKNPNSSELASYGLSPDDIYEHLQLNKDRKTTKFITTSTCNSLLN